MGFVLAAGVLIVALVKLALLLGSVLIVDAWAKAAGRATHTTTLQDAPQAAGVDPEEIRAAVNSLTRLGYTRGEAAQFANRAVKEFGAQDAEGIVEQIIEHKLLKEGD
jgi:Holliday junction resolvasome RuvABC DNA-binding subunit